MVTKRECIILCYFLRKCGITPVAWYNGLFITDNRLWLNRELFNVCPSDVSADTLIILAKKYNYQYNIIVYHKFV